MCSRYIYCAAAACTAEHLRFRREKNSSRQVFSVVALAICDVMLRRRDGTTPTAVASQNGERRCSVVINKTIEAGVVNNNNKSRLDGVVRNMTITNADLTTVNCFSVNVAAH